MKYNIIKICVMCLLSTILLSSCTEYKVTKCDICGKNKKCHLIYYDKENNYGNWVCSKQCERTAKAQYNVLDLFGGVRK